MFKVVKYVIIDILRNKIVIAYTICLLALSVSFFSIEDNVTKGLLSLMNIVLILVPLVSIIFSTIYIYNSSEFIELLLAQPIRRTKLLLSIFSGLFFSFVIAFLVGVGLPVLLLAPSETSFYMVVSGLMLTAIFVSLSLIASVKTRDKARGIGVAIMFWLIFSLLYDGLLMFLMFQFGDYPLEKPMILLTSLNPIDLARILMLLKLDTSALMGYTGAVFNKFFGTNLGVIYSLGIMAVWVIIPVFSSVRIFKKKDL
jgi:Cu-processing system permease protein